VEESRRQSISDAFAFLTRLIEKYQQDRVICTSGLSTNATRRKRKNLACDSTMLGSLLKSARKNGLWPVPPSPFNGLQVVDLLGKMRALEPVAICDADLINWKFSEGEQPPPSHGVKWSIDSQMNYLEGRVDGLELEDLD